MGRADEHLDTEAEARGTTLTVGELLNPLRAPRRLLGATEATLAAVQLHPRLPAVMIGRLGSVERNLQKIVATLLELAAGIERVEHTLGPQAERVGDIEAAVHRMEGLQGEVQDATEHLPLHGSNGPIDRMRNALKGPS